MGLRYHIEPGDAPAEVAARRMGLSVLQFERALPDLRKRGFPAPDTTTNLYDLQAIDEWRKRRHPQLFGQTDNAAVNARLVVKDRLARIMENG